ncbi:MAG: sulfotransferase family protein [Minisyncoccales bacterium]
MKKPNFFIIGAPRSGTTFMQKHLGAHSDIFMAKGEPSFFCPDYTKPRLSKKDYFNLFNEGRDKKIVGEKTVFYLPSKIAPEKIYEFNPQAKILVMLRNPIEAAYSFHSKMVSVGRETITDFKKAWQKQNKREIKKDRIYKGHLKKKTLIYGDLYKLGAHLRRYYNRFPKENVKPILFDSLVENEENVYKEVLQFLDLSFDDRKDFSKVNPHTQPKSQLINSLLRVRGILPVEKIKKIFGIKKQIGLLGKLMRSNQKKIKREPLEKDFKRELSNFFKEDVKLLSDLINKDLNHWLED